MRTYITGQFEVVEYPDSLELPATHLALGRSLADFSHGDFTPLFPLLEETPTLLAQARRGGGRQRRVLFAALKQLAAAHCYFGVFARYAQEYLEGRADDGSYFAHMPTEILREQNNLSLLLERCLAAEGGEIANRYLVMEAEGAFEQPYSLQYQYVRLEAVPDETGDVRLCEVLVPGDLFDVIDFYKAHMLKNGISFRRCKSCGRYFVPAGRRGAEYCGRLLPGSGKTCREAGAMQVYRQKRRELPVVREYERAYKRLHARKKAGTLSPERFAQWAAEARRRRDACMEDGADQALFSAWLKENP